MKEIKIHDKVFIPYIAFEEIEHAIKRMANTIYQEHKDDIPVFVGVLNVDIVSVAVVSCIA